MVLWCCFLVELPSACFAKTIGRMKFAPGNPSNIFAVPELVAVALSTQPDCITPGGSPHTGAEQFHPLARMELLLLQHNQEVLEEPTTCYGQTCCQPAQAKNQPRHMSLEGREARTMTQGETSPSVLQLHLFFS